jgi:uncharacterized membrane protein
VPAMSLALGLVLSMIALVVAVIALLARARRAEDPEFRIAALEAEVRALVARVLALETTGGRAAAPAAAPPPAIVTPTVPVTPVPSAEPAPLGPAAIAEPAATGEPSAIPSPPAARKPALDLEQRIGARWATWVGVIVILVAAALFLKWAFDNAYLGPGARVGVGLVGGLLMLMAGLGLHRRRDVPYLSEGLAGGGLGCLYLSLFAAQTLYGLIGATTAFTAMFAVTLLGTAVAVLTSRLSTAVLAVLGGLLTPVLLHVERPDERNLLAYLLVLDVLVLLVARFRTWPVLAQVAWGGSALLLLPTIGAEVEAPRPLARLLLLTALFLVFLLAPLFRERATGRRTEPLDLLLVVANAAGYFWAVYVTLEAVRPTLEGPWALGLAVLYRVVSADYAGRVPDDPVPVLVHEGAGWTFLTIAVPLALDLQWVTLAWAAEGVMLLWLATRAPAAVATWGGLAALLLAGIRAVALDRYWSPGTVPVWNLVFLIHLGVVLALLVGGVLAGRAAGGSPDDRRPVMARAVLWVAAVVTLAVLLWREPPGLWPATLLTLELLVVGLLARGSRSPAFPVGVAVLAAVLACRVLVADDDLARRAAGSLLSLPLLSRIGACLAIGLAGGGLARASSATARQVGAAVSGAAGLILLFVLSVGWTRYQDGLAEAALAARRVPPADIRWRTQVGLSVLWTVYAGLALAWGFVRGNRPLRYAALGLLGLTVVKVFAVDFAAVKTSYRILSFLVLGIVLLLVSLAYQKLVAKRS